MSAFFGARAPELVPEHVNDLNIKSATQRKMPLHERSLSDLNKTNNGKPTIRLVNSNSENDSPGVYGKTALPTKPAHILKPGKAKDQIYIDVPDTDARPSSRDGYTAVPNRPSNKKANRISISTTHSNADTLVADSLFSPVSQRFSVDLSHKSQNPHFDAMPELPEQSSDYAAQFTSDDGPDIPELPSSVPDRPRHMAHSSSCYSNSPWDDLRPPTPPRMRRRSSSSGLGFVVSPISERAEDSLYGPAAKPSKDSMVSGSTQERGTPHIIRYMNSSESIQPQYASVRPAPHHARSMSSLWSAESVDAENIAPLHIPRKRAHMHSGSLNSHPSLSRLGAGGLSTIHSDAEAGTSSWTTQQSPPVGGQSWPRRRRAATSSSYSGSLSTPRLTQGVKPSSSYDSMSSDLPSSDSAVPEPLFSSSAPLPQKPFEPSSNHYSTELDDTIGELQAPPLKEKRSGYFLKKRSNSELRPGSKQSNHSAAETDRWSTGSFIFPQWAKYFYTGKSALMSANPSRVTLAGPPYSHTAEISHVTLAGPPYAMMNASTRSLDLNRPQLRHQHSRTETIETFMTRPESSQSNWETIYTESPASRVVNNIFRSRGRPRSQTDIRPVSRAGSSQSPVRHRKTLSVYSGPSTGPNSPEIEQIPRAPRHSTRVSLRHPLKQNPAANKTARKMSVRTQKSNTSHARATTPWLRSYSSFPHLVQNARLAQTFSAWHVPSIDEPFPAEILGRGNRQIVCFCLGFLFPPLWMLAAVLPLPHCGWRQDEQGGNVTEKPRPEAAVGLDLEVDEQWGWEDERKFLKARWWRNLNRIMSVVGVGILAAIITLAVLASRG
ncbi:hypothetical protein K461DRAFT_266218 [Myriangium duriaei CBS 260.36]|uniref:Serine-rich protein n=1 Tax=Myriangium duriaei CBS 260.36 TaxID=1168546 RepID=A0A9P4J6A1_9PEZI|nr:hypothetical protein K461DRAFT_266218 [Myriangium duriaei CBS 260.36]